MQKDPSKKARFTPLERLALFIRNLPQHDKAKLITLVPELQSIKPEITSISQQQIELMSFFDQFSDRALPSLPDNAQFIDNFTFSEFFNLPNDEQASVWQNAHITNEG